MAYVDNKYEYHFVRYILRRLSNNTACDGFPITEDIDRLTDCCHCLVETINAHTDVKAILTTENKNVKYKLMLRKIKTNPTEDTLKTLTEMGKSILNFDCCRSSEINKLLGTNLPVEESDSGDY